MKRPKRHLACFAQIVRDERLAAGLSQEKMGALLNVRGKTISLWEHAQMGGGCVLLRAWFEGSFVAAALAQRILHRTYPSVGEEGKQHASEFIPMSDCRHA
jgi:transcriptional regulator with XRE-family HTH domain